MVDWRQHIAIEADKLAGNPCVRGFRFSVGSVLEYLASGMTIDEILADSPYLTGDDIFACLACAAERERGTAVVTT